MKKISIWLIMSLISFSLAIAWIAEKLKLDIPDIKFDSNDNP